jgi:hypothetical protein
MITVKMAYEDMIYAVKVCLKSHKLHLRALATIDKKKMIFDFQQLSGGMSSVRRQRSACSQYCDFKTHLLAVKQKDQNVFQVLVQVLNESQLI